MPAKPSRPVPTPFGQGLRHWRRLRGLSQLRLAVLAGTTPRHLSFVETGRSRPGRELVLRLAEVLDVPVRDRNALLAAAGLGPAYPEHALDAEALRPVLASMQSVLDGHDPNPAAVVDARGVTLLANAAARRLFPGALAMSAEESVDAFFGRWGPAHVENWPEVAWAAADRRRARAQASSDPELQRLSERVRHHLRDTPRPPSLAPDAMPPVIYARLRLGDERLSVFSAVLRFEGARDVTLSELGVELTFPADAPTAEFLRKAAEGATLESRSAR